MLSFFSLPSSFPRLTDPLTESLVTALQQATLATEPVAPATETAATDTLDEPMPLAEERIESAIEPLTENPLEDPFALLYEEEVPVTLSAMNDPAVSAPAGGANGWLVGTGTAGSLLNSTLLIAGADYITNLTLKDLVGYDLTEEDIEAFTQEAEEFAEGLQQDYDSFQWPDGNDVLESIEIPLVSDLLGGDLLGGLLGGVVGGVLDTVTDILI